MKKLLSILLFLILGVGIQVAAQYTYESYDKDPTGLRLYTLKNGLKVYLAKNQDEPKIQTFIAVRAGSNYDPADNTGLAHYLEHMLFKGTHNIGAIKWEEEKPYLEKIAQLYEEHKTEKDPELKKKIYKQIDSVSYAASKLCIANEYDKMISGLGAQGTNAHTWYEETVYKNKIPANELEKWMKIEGERFSTLVLRLFHTELEAVYEEFNRAQDNDYRKVYYNLMRALFPKHPYGQQTTIGVSDHLKNPSMKAIHNYFDKYYVPSNMAVVLVGDLDFDKTIAMVDTYFGGLKGQPVKHPTLPKETPLKENVAIEVSGPTAPSVSFAYKFDGLESKDHLMVTLIDMILNNSSAGLIDINLNQKQKVLSAGCSPTFMNDYGWHSFYGNPKSGQSLEEVEKLILGELDKVKKGQFESWIIEAVVNDLKLNQIRQFESATATATQMYDAFIHHQSWQQILNFNDKLSQITKSDIVKFANEKYNQYAIVYKRKGENSGIVKVENPGITPIETNRDKSSKYLENIKSMPYVALSPMFVDYKKELNHQKMGNLDFYTKENTTNPLFYISYVYDMGEENDKLLPLAIKYLKYLGTSDQSPEDVKKAFYKLGVDYGVNVSDHRSYVYLTGLQKNYQEGVKLFEHLLARVKADPAIYQQLVKTIEKEREDANLDKGNIFWTGLFSKALYGDKSPALTRLSMQEISAVDPNVLTSMVQSLNAKPHEVFVYAQKPEVVSKYILSHHNTPKVWEKVPPRDKPQVLKAEDKVFFYDYDMVQSEIAFVTKDVPLDKESLALVSVFNEYFGSGLSSIVFQEIRESKSLAYSAFASYSTPSEEDDPHLVYAYMGTQANKLPEAVKAMKSLLNELPYSKDQFDAAKSAALKKIEAQRITKQKVYWNYLRLRDMGMNNDYRKEVYAKIKNLEFDDLKAFFDRHIKGKEFNYIVIGNKEDVDMDALQKLGTLQEVKLEDLFKN